MGAQGAADRRPFARGAGAGAGIGFTILDDLAAVAATFGWTEAYALEQSPRKIWAYLRSHDRNVAKSRPDDAVTAGFVHMDSEMKQQQLNLWATIARGDDPAKLSGVGSTKVVKEADVADWLRKHGGRRPEKVVEEKKGV